LIAKDKGWLGRVVYADSITAFQMDIKVWLFGLQRISAELAVLCTLTPSRFSDGYQGMSVWIAKDVGRVGHVVYADSIMAFQMDMKVCLFGFHYNGWLGRVVYTDSVTAPQMDLKVCLFGLQRIMADLAVL
jgi:hypothetical protein